MVHDFQHLPKDRPWIIKAGFDPTTPDLHLGHAVLLRKLRAWQNEGHTVVMIVGDFTASVGDPTGKSQTRPVLTQEEIAQNATTYMDQAFLILDRTKTRVVKNSTWLNEMTPLELLSVLQQFTVSQMLARHDFSQRMEQQKPLGLHELLYPVLQGLDSVHVCADIELGGNDQLFNLLAGRRLQALHNMPEQVVVTLPLLLGLDGVNKMSKSLGNHIPLLSNSFDMFSKLMAIPDSAMDNMCTCFELTLVHSDPFLAKKEMAEKVTAIIHGAQALDARKQWELRFSAREIDGKIEDFSVGTGQTLLKTLVSCGFVSSSREGRQKIKEGAVRIDGTQVFDGQMLLEAPCVLSLGRRHMVRLVPQVSPAVKLK